MITGMSWLDFKMGLRMLTKYPALTLVGGIGIAVGVAVSVGFFAFAGAHIYPELPLEEGDRIVALENRDTELNNENRRALHDFVLWRQELRTIDDLGAFRTVERNLIPREGVPMPVHVAEMTAAGFRVARVPPLLGRHLVEDDERIGAAPVLVIGHDVWQSRFAGEPGIIGREVRLGGTRHTVVGVMPEEFAFPQSHGYWTAFRADPAAYARGQGPGIFIFGRLAPGVTMDEAQAELETIGRRTAAEFPATNAKLVPMVMPYIHSLTDIQGITPWMVIQMQLMVSLLLVVVALNVALLVYARTATRQGEIAVRAALGASRRRIVGQLFVEALVLSLGAALLGLAIAQIGVNLGNQILEQELGSPFWASYDLKPSTVLFTVGVGVLAAVIVGVLPAMQATGRNLRDNLSRLGGGTGTRLGRTWTVLIVAQVAIAVAALPAAVNMGWGEIRSATTRSTFPPEEYLLVEMAAQSPTDAGVAPDPRADSLRFTNQLTELMRRVEAEPAVVGVTFTTSLPGRSGLLEVEGVAPPADSPTGHRVASEGVDGDFFAVYDARILTGRAFEPGDAAAEATAVIVSQSFARQILGDASPLGRRVRYVSVERSAGADEVERSRWFEIVGVVEDLAVNTMDPTLVRPRIYYPVAPGQAQAVSLEMRLRGTTPADFAPRLREIGVAVDPALRMGTTYSMADFERQDRLAVRLVALVLGLILLSVFLLSAAGVYALTSFTVTRRRREIGIRTALGALPRQVLQSVFGRVARQIALGLVIGIGGAAIVDRLSGGGLLGGRAGFLLPTFGVLMVIVALLAALGPARRGLRIQPIEALRSDG